MRWGVVMRCVLVRQVAFPWPFLHDARVLLAQVLGRQQHCSSTAALVAGIGPRGFWLKMDIGLSVEVQIECYPQNGLNKLWGAQPPKLSLLACCYNRVGSLRPYAILTFVYQTTTK